MAENIKNLGKVCITPEGVWDVNKEYDRLSLVVTTDVNTQKALSYVSRKHVPKGNINIKDTEYWQLFTTELKLEDITIDENGNVKIGDVVIYQIPLGDALGEIVVNKIKHDLTDYIMTEIRSYMTSMVQELINSFSNQIGRLINTGIEIRNKVSGGMTNHNIDEITHYGNINLKHSGGTNNTNTEEIHHSGNIGINNSGRIENIISGNINTNVKVNGELYVDGDEPTPVTKYTVVVNTTPSDAVVTLNGVQTNTGEFDEGSTILVVVSKSGYITRMETITNIQQNATLNINLVEEQTQYYVDVYTTPSDAIVKLNGTVGNHLLFNRGETITVEVSKEGYITHTEYINNLQENTNITVVLDEEAVQYIFIVNPTEKAVGATSSQFPIEVRSVRNNQGYDYEYITEDPDNLIQSIVKETGGVKVVTNGNALDRTKTATIYFKQYRPEEEVIHVTIPFVITQETDTPSSYIFTSNLINNWNDKSINNYLGGVPVGGNAYDSPNGIDIISTKNGEPFDYEITQKPSWINFTKHLQNNTLNFALDAVELSSTLTQITGKVVLTQRDSGKTLEFTLIRCKGYIYVIDSPLIYNKNAHYTEDLKIITCFCVDNTGFNYTPGKPSLSSQDNHPNWIGIDDSSFEDAQLISTSYYYYYKIRFGIQKNEGNQRTGTVTITVGGDNDINYPIEFTQEGEDTPTPTTKYTVTVDTTPVDAIVTLNGVEGKTGEFDAGSNIEVSVSKTGYQTHTETISNIQENKTLAIALSPDEPVPPTPTYEFVGILTGEGGDYEQDLTTAIRLTTSANQVTLTPRVKIDGQLREDIDVNITANGFSQGAQNTNKFNVNSSGTALTIQTSGEEPSEPISTSYDITVNYDGHVESATFAIDWDV